MWNYYFLFVSLYILVLNALEYICHMKIIYDICVIVISND